MLGAEKTGTFTKHSRTLPLQIDKGCWSPVCWGSGMKWILIQEAGDSVGSIMRTQKLMPLNLLKTDQGNVGCVDINLVDMTVSEARKALTHQATKRRSHSAHSRLTGLTELGALWPALWSVNPLQHTPPPTASESQLRLYGLEGLEERWKQPLGDDHFPPEELDQLPAWMRPGASSRRNQHASPSTAPLAARKEAKDAIALAASSLTDAIRRDWLRTTQDLRTLDNGFTCRGGQKKRF
ncbi:hypothetical protein CEUSTIGMA_g7649.t1 [Chlamydomonas eustigma]|uniref:Uncharacterized protein n=1 Tax=Chlamydomonas eustigma TaxID=1157962 RepID=A0A250XAV0_9CHLO|nr:hypothetical protein CEUSTIGMA_g7649.t1 [Chlamydomonas eustigma]|eukprot:GAX80211.1 hypothetical protein CEUSTIGMA_g7649.t1 [Chlamydomonas eustigma]